MGKEEYRLILRFTAIKKPKAKGFWLFKNKFLQIYAINRFCLNGFSQAGY